MSQAPGGRCKVWVGVLEVRGRHTMSQSPGGRCAGTSSTQNIGGSGENVASRASQAQLLGSHRSLLNADVQDLRVNSLALGNAGYRCKGSNRILGKFQPLGKAAETKGCLQK
ncbi:hypothetical protein FKM82_008353 [Ascaphus truei]